MGRVKCWANVKPNPANYQVLGRGSCRSANVWTYPNHYLKTDSTSALTRSACVKQCNADEGCTHMEWGFNGNGERQCVIFPRAVYRLGGPSFLAMVAGRSPRQITGRT